MEPFRLPNFGTPEDVQKSVSCGITIFRLWRKVLELKKMRLHSLPNAKTDPSKRGKFITHGCYKTAEILFAAATTHQPAMFLHFKDLGPSWASPYNSGTKSTQRIIGEMQGKTTELQSLDAQPTFRNMLDRSSKVQFNLNAKQRLATSGANVKVSNNRKKIAFAFQSKKHLSNYAYPAGYSEFREAQLKAHQEGVKEGQALFAKYLPQACIDVLKETGNWEKPYSYSKPEGYTMVNGPPPKDFNKLDTSFAHVSIPDVESKCCDESEEAPLRREEVATESDGENEFLVNTGDEEDEANEDLKGVKDWKISKRVNGKLTYIHVTQAIKILLQGEYVSRCRQKRHWASKFLPGKEPLNPTHDIYKYCDVAVMVTQKGKSWYRIGRVEAMESTKDGSEIVSFELKRKTPVRIPCSLYSHRKNEVYCVSADALLTKWKSQASIISKVDLQPVSGESGMYTLHPSSKAHLLELGILPFYHHQDDSLPSLIEGETQGWCSSEMDDDFYEVEDVMDMRLSKDTLCYEYKARFKGYGSNQDMWLPSSFFNRPVQFKSISKFGRKWKHRLDPDNVSEQPKRKCQRKSKSAVERDQKTYGECEIGKGKTVVDVDSKGSESRAPLSQRKTKKKATTEQGKRRPNRLKDKGKAFCSSLRTSVMGDELPEVSVMSSTDSTTKKENDTSEASSETEGRTGLTSKFDEQLAGTSSFVASNNVNDVTLGKKVSIVQEGILPDVLRYNDNFSNPRRILAEAAFPKVDETLRTYTKGKRSDCVLTDPLQVDKLPPLSVIDEISKEFRAGKHTDLVVKFPLYGNFDKDGVRILQQFHRLKCLRRDVQFEKKWLQSTFSKEDRNLQKQVTHALLDRKNTEGSYLASYSNYRITSQELSLLCGERYLSDEILNFLVEMHCNKSNEQSQVDKNILLPSFLSTGDVLRSVVEHICLSKDMERVVNMFMPVHMNMCHWGLAIFSVQDQTVMFDDGYHCPIPDSLKSNAKKILNIIFETTGSDKYQPLNWNTFKRFTFPMPDQPEDAGTSKNGIGSCGVAVICSVRDICNNRNAKFTWSYEDSPRLRAELMMEILGILH